MSALTHALRVIASQAALLRRQQRQNDRLLITLRLANDNAERAKDVAAEALEEITALRRRVETLMEFCPADLSSLGEP